MIGPRTIAALTVLAVLSGCYAFYDHRIVGPEASVYGDHNRPRLESTARFVERAMVAFRRLFPERGDEVSPPRVVFEVDELSRQHVYLPHPRQEGYYLPMLRLVHLSPQIVESASSDPGAALDDLDAARVVALHELSHHFLISLFPESNSEYWLNEGFACVMETARIGDDGALVVPHFHPWLHRRARLALLDELGRDGFLREVERLLDASWMSFHRGGHKTRNYAISYVVVNHLLAKLEGSLEERMRTILSLEDAEILAELNGLLFDVEQPPAVRLKRLAEVAEHRAWALREWIDLGTPDRPPLANELHRSLASADSRERLLGCTLAARMLNQHRDATCPALRRLSSALVDRLQTSTPAEQQAIASEIDPRGYLSPFLAPLVELLEARDSDVRVAAAGALARSGVKATITRPQFWRDVESPILRNEVREWQRWIGAHSSSSSVEPSSFSDRPMSTPKNSDLPTTR